MVQQAPVIRRFPALPLTAAVAIPLIPLAYREYAKQQTRRSTAIQTPEGIQSLEKVVLGGLEQWILIRGQNATNPIVLFLHGGPGLPLMPFRPVLSELEKHFTVVYWDQRGAGKSYHQGTPAETMRIEQFVSDAVELVNMLRSRFHQQKIHLVGYSWGGVIGLKAVAQSPELFHAYVGVGQVVNMKDGERLSYQFVLDKARETGDQVALRQLEQMGLPPYRNYRDVLQKRLLVERYGGFIHHDGMTSSEFYRSVFVSPDYTLADVLHVFQGINFSLRHLWYPLYEEVDLFSQVKQVGVPVYFFEGRYDELVPSEVLQCYFEQLKAPRGKSLIWFDHSAHLIFLEEPEKFQDMLVNKVLQETYHPAMKV